MTAETTGATGTAGTAGAAGATGAVGATGTAGATEAAGTAGATGTVSAPEVSDRMESTREELRPWARAQLGVTGEAVVDRPLGATLTGYGLSWYPITALGLLAIVDTFHAYGFAVLTPEISSTLGIGKGAIAGVIALKTLAIALAPLPMAALAQRRARRALLCVVTGVLWSLVAISTGFVVAVGGLVAVLVLDGLTTGSVSALHQPLLVDAHPPEARMRALSLYQAADGVGNVVAPLAVTLLVAGLGFTWRGVFVVLGVVSLLATLAAVRLRDPGFGRFDTERLRQAVRRRQGQGHGQDEGENRGPGADERARQGEAMSHGPGEAEGARLGDDEGARPGDDGGAGPGEAVSPGPGETAAEGASLGFFEVVRRLLLVPTVRRLLIGHAVVGVMLVPLETFTFFFLDERWNLGPGPRGLFFAFTAAVGVVALAVLGRRIEALYRSEPGRPLRLGAACLALAVVLVAGAALSPWLWVTVALFGAVAALSVVTVPALAGPLLSVVAPPMRPHASALTGIFVGGVGGLAGALFLAGIDRRFGIGGALVALVIPGLVGALVIASAAPLASRDLDRLIDDVLEDEELRRISRAGGHLPLLACRGIEQSYGPVQVLFGVDFTVDDGEMVALLGVNGAGKSTLLRVVSGLSLPSGGTVRLHGVDITYLDAERRLGLGITQVSGGEAVFGPLTVVENLRAFGYALGRDRRALDEAIARSFDAFPVLAERRNQPAATLSGGEQQMLGLTKALIQRPRLLLIDELSLGLAPLVVDQLLDLVRQINATGTAVVLVEQSVNIALGLVDHAYFMEKGEIRFDGPAAELRQRSDLLRAVFLDGRSEGSGDAAAPTDPTGPADAPERSLT